MILRFCTAPKGPLREFQLVGCDVSVVQSLYRHRLPEGGGGGRWGWKWIGEKHIFTRHCPISLSKLTMILNKYPPDL